MLTGEGAFRFELDRRWAKLPARKRFGTTHAIAHDASGRVFVGHTAAECVFVFSPDGEFLDAWGGDYFAGTHGLDIRREGGGEFVYLTSNDGVVVKTTLSGEEVLRIGQPPRPDIYDGERKYVPTETAVSAGGDIFVADGYGQFWVHHFSPAGAYIDSFNGAPGRPLNNPHGIMIETRSGEERLLVADRENRVLRTFDLAGGPLAAIDAGLRYPCSAIQSGEYLYVPDLHSRITVLDRDDRPVAEIGDWPGRWQQAGWPNLPSDGGGRLSSPHDLDVDGKGDIYLAEWRSDGTGAVSKLTRLG